jgi:hypothetical protein
MWRVIGTPQSVAVSLNPSAAGAWMTREGAFCSVAAFDTAATAHVHALWLLRLPERPVMNVVQCSACGREVARTDTHPPANGIDVSVCWDKCIPRG